jgi:hypothetical protein
MSTSNSSPNLGLHQDLRASGYSTIDSAKVELQSALDTANYRTRSGQIDPDTLSDHAFLFCTIHPRGPDGTGLRLCSANTMNRMALCQSVMNGTSPWSTTKGYAFDRARAVVQATYIHTLFFHPSDPIQIFVSQETTRFLEEALHELFPDTYVVCFVELWGNHGGTGCHEGGYATILRSDSAVKVEAFDKINAMIPCRSRAGEEHEKNVGMLTVLSFEGVSFCIVNVHLPCGFVGITLEKVRLDERVLSLPDAYLVGDFNMAPRQKHFPDHTMRAIKHTGGNWSDHCLYLERAMPVQSTPYADEVLKEVVVATLDVATLDVATPAVATLDVATLDIATLDVATLDVATPAVVQPYVPPHRRDRMNAQRSW